MLDREPRVSSDRAFVRELPGGGFAAIDISVNAPLWRRPTYCGTLSVERRNNWRAMGRSPPVIGTATGPTAESVMCQLLPIALSNAAIAAALSSLDGRRMASLVASRGVATPA